ncbi:hypothetical protein [Rhodobacter sp. NSM]|uniref:hypothetical protein n=1 Tax=Rhodobacter sp. NSM TaxID=3457501 RepID=UPI003FD4C2C6
MISEPTERRRALFRSRRTPVPLSADTRAEMDPCDEPDDIAMLDESGCIWKAAGLCPGQSEVNADGSMVCLCAQVLMAPSPDKVIDTLTDLGLSDEQIGRYFHIPVRCVTALRRPT